MIKYLLALFFTLLFSCQYFKKENDEPVSLDPIDLEIKKLSDGILDSPRNANLYYKRGQLYWEKKENERALNDFYKMTSYDSSKPEYFLTLAEFFVDNGNIERGIAALNVASELDPYKAEYHILQGKYCLYIKKYQDAINHLNNGLKRDIHNPDAYIYKAIVYRETKNIPKAISNLVTATEQDPTRDEPFELLGEIYADKKDDLCLKYFDNASKANPSNTTAQNQKAYYLQTNGRIDEAAKIYEELVNKNPQNIEAIYNLGVISYKQKNYKKAIQQLDICIKMDPSNALAYFMVGRTQLALGDKTKAKAAFNQAFIFDDKMVEAKREADKL